MENYQILLKDPRWLLKRKEILERDNYSCKKCGCGNDNQLKSKFYDIENFNFDIEFIKSDNNKYNILRIKRNNVFDIVCKTNISIDNFNKNHKYFLVINFGVKGVLNNYFNGSMDDQALYYSNYFFEKYPNDDILNAIYKKIPDNIYEIDLENIWFIHENNREKFNKNFLSLHVHHKCYRSDHQIWNQNNLEYITLCNICHDTIHRNQKIPFYDKHQNVTHFMEACDRCNGSGHIDQYKHIQGGICFKCKGNCYFPI